MDSRVYKTTKGISFIKLQNIAHTLFDSMQLVPGPHPVATVYSVATMYDAQRPGACPHPAFVCVPDKFSHFVLRYMNEI